MDRPRSFSFRDYFRLSYGYTMRISMRTYTYSRMAHEIYSIILFYKETSLNLKILIFNIQLTKKLSYFFHNFNRQFFLYGLIEQYILDIFFLLNFCFIRNWKVIFKRKKNSLILKITLSWWKRNCFNFRIKKLFINLNKKIILWATIYKKK